MATSIPFISQMSEDWQADGFPSAVEANHWQQRGCGIACVRMLLHATTPAMASLPENSYWGLIQKGLKLNAYCQKGWIHKGLLTLLETFDIHGQCHRNITPAQLAGILDKGHPVIVSVTVRFQGGKRRSLRHFFRKTPKGGHLVLALAARRNESGQLTHIICHHPSVYKPWNLPQTEVDITSFSNSFSGNGIEVFL